MNTRASRISLSLVTFLLGVLLMAQFATQHHIDLKRASTSGADGALLISNLVDGNARLRQEIADLDAQTASYRSATNQARLQAMMDELDRLKIVNGAAEVSGPGVQATLDGPASVLDLQDLLNELRNAGAEALALNGRRIIASSVIMPTPDGDITVDRIVVRRPYLFAAIGDPATLETALLRPGGLVAVFANSREGIRVNVQRQDRLVAPAHIPVFMFQYAAPVKP
jgi:uncharacterized protein YlxW (UPF0749 family)